MHSHIDFGYLWQWTYGHLVVVAIGLALLGVGKWRGWGRWVMGAVALLTLWAVAGFVIVRFILDFNGPATMPKTSFLTSGRGKIVDIGAGTGRSTLMVLEAKPETTVVAVDLFADEYVHHFGDIGNLRIVANLEEAGMQNRATVKTADMRELPFADGEFDGVVSAYAIDHLNTEGIRKSLKEAARVAKPGSDFLLMVVDKDLYLQLAFGPLMMHGGTRSAARWNELLREAGFAVIEQGKQPATYYFLARKR